MKKPLIYIIGSLKNRRNVMKLANNIRAKGFEVFDDWTSPGPEADSFLYEYYKQRGFSYREMIQSLAAQNNYLFDRRNLERADGCVMLGPAGKSCHLELGWFCKDKPAFVLFPREPKRADIMYGFLGGNLCFNEKDLIKALKKEFKRLR